MFTGNKSCYKQETLSQLLAQQTDEVMEQEMLHHIEGCSKCRNALERISGGGPLQDEMREHLACDEFSCSPHESVQAIETEPDIESIRSFLGPSDDPTKMGRIAGFEICGIIGFGSSAVVFKAFDPRLNRYVAIKTLLPQFCHHGSARSRFEREGKAIASVKDENVIPVYAVDEYRGQPYLVMQYMPDGSLREYLRKNGPLDSESVICIGQQIARGLAAAHRSGVIHRDVKPANVLLDGGVSKAKVTDFGLARVQDDAGMTHSGAISGTPAFMSPEQTRGEQLDHRSDLFSLGSLLYSACTASAPFRSETVSGVIRRVCDTEPNSVLASAPDTPPWVAQLIENLMQKSPGKRFRDADEVADILAAELAYLRAPQLNSKPNRDWMKSVSPSRAQQSSAWVSAETSPLRTSR